MSEQVAWQLGSKRVGVGALEARNAPEEAKSVWKFRDQEEFEGSQGVGPDSARSMKDKAEES